MSDRVCQDDCEAYRLFGTPDEFALEAIKDDINYGMSQGLMVWRAIAFALERGMDLPDWARQYLAATAKGIDDWAMLNGHPSELKSILALGGKRIQKDESRDPRWIYEAICQMREGDPEASVASLVREFLKKFPESGDKPEERVRQKYYQGKRLAEKGEDYKGRGRNVELSASPFFGGDEVDEIPDF